MLIRVIAKSKDRTECYAEIVDSVHPFDGDLVFVEPVSGFGYFCNVSEIIDIDEADILHKCGMSIVKIRLKGDAQE